MSKLFKATIYVAAINLFGLALNFLLNLVLASKFGAGNEMDCYLTGTAFPSYLVTILTGSLSVTFIPAFVERKNSENRWNLMTSLLVVGMIIAAILSCLIFFFSVELIQIQAPGFSVDLIQYSSFLLRCYLLALVLTVVNEIFSGIFYAEGQFVIPMLNKIIGPSITLAILWIYGKDASAVTVVYSTVAGLFIQTVLLILTFVRRGYKLQLGEKIFNKDLFQLGQLMLPLLLGSIFYKCLPVFDKYFLSRLPEGSISLVNYAQKFFLAITQVLGAALSMQVLSHMSNLVSDSNFGELKKFMNGLVKLILFVSIPLVGTFLLLGDDLVRVIYERGLFTKIDTAVVGLNFKIYSLAIPAVALGTLISQGLYVLKDTWSPFVVGLFEVLIYIGICFLMVGEWGLVALPISYVIYFYFSVIMLGLILTKKVNFIRGFELFETLVKLVTITGLELLFVHFVFGQEGLSVVGLVLQIGFIFLVYITTSYFLKYDEALFISRKILLEAHKITDLFQKGKGK